MIKSRFCVLNKQGDESLIKYGECVSDPGGYFIINGSEKVIVAQEQLSWNHVYIFKKTETQKSIETLSFYTKEGVLYFAECRSVADFGKWTPSLLTVKVCVTPFSRKKSNQIAEGDKFVSYFSGGLYLRVILPYFKQDIPVSWIFKALGFENEKEMDNMDSFLEKHNIDLNLNIPSLKDLDKKITDKEIVESIKKRNRRYYVLVVHELQIVGRVNFFRTRKTEVIE